MADWLQRIEGNSVKSAKGGTELLYDGLIKYTDFNQYDDINLLLSTPNISKIRYTKKNIIWQHLNYIDELLAPLRDQAFMKAIDASVYVSHWQLEKFRYIFQVPLHNSYVIKNAIEPIELKPKYKTDKIKLIYTSTPFRGLSALLDAFEMLNRDDIELDVYSSTVVYGTGYAEHHRGIWEDLFDRAKAMKNVNYHGYASNDEIKSALQNAHIFSYPSIFEETACLAMIEAGAAGCQLLTTNLGALLETGSEYARMIPIQSNEKLLAANYAQALNETIDGYWNHDNQEMLKEQSDFYNKYYNWDRRAKEWNRFFEIISQSK
jgi:glycosyltransferase involved in cell wall biosynthesis